MVWFFGCFFLKKKGPLSGMLLTRSFAGRCSCEVLLEDARRQGDAQGWELLQVSPRAPRPGTHCYLHFHSLNQMHPLNSFPFTAEPTAHQQKWLPPHQQPVQLISTRIPVGGVWVLLWAVWLSVAAVFASCSANPDSAGAWGLCSASALPALNTCSCNRLHPSIATAGLSAPHRASACCRIAFKMEKIW